MCDIPLFWKPDEFTMLELKKEKKKKTNNLLVYTCETLVQLIPEAKRCQSTTTDATWTMQFFFFFFCVPSCISGVHQSG